MLNATEEVTGTMADRIDTVASVTVSTRWVDITARVGADRAVDEGRFADQR